MIGCFDEWIFDVAYSVRPEEVLEALARLNREDPDAS